MSFIEHLERNSRPSGDSSLSKSPVISLKITLSIKTSYFLFWMGHLSPLSYWAAPKFATQTVQLETRSVSLFRRSLARADLSATLLKCTRILASVSSLWMKFMSVIALNPSTICTKKYLASLSVNLILSLRRLSRSPPLQNY